MSTAKVLHTRDDTTIAQLTTANIQTHDITRRRRGCFLWLPVVFRNDLVHGSWWFVAGSVVSVGIAVPPLFRHHIPIFEEANLSLNALNYAATWGLLIASGIFFSLGSLAFVFAFDDPPTTPPFQWRHISTWELIAAWMFLLAVLPGLPYSIIFLITDMYKLTYIGMLVLAVIFIVGSYLFVLTCYPRRTGQSEKGEHSTALVKKFVLCTGCCSWWKNMVEKHLCNDWLAGTWFFAIATFLGVCGGIYESGYSISTNNGLEIYIWVTGTIDAIMFLIGSMYYVAGSYPQDQQHSRSVHPLSVVSYIENNSPPGSAPTPGEQSHVSVVKLASLVHINETTQHTPKRLS